MADKKKYDYDNARHGRAQVKHIINASRTMIDALPRIEDEGAVEKVNEAYYKLGSALHSLAGTQRLSRNKQVEFVKAAAESVEVAHDALFAVKDAYSGTALGGSILTETIAVLTVADEHLADLVTFLEERPNPYSGKKREYFPGEDGAPEDSPAPDTDDESDEGYDYGENDDFLF